MYVRKQIYFKRCIKFDEAAELDLVSGLSRDLTSNIELLIESDLGFINKSAIRESRESTRTIAAK